MKNRTELSIKLNNYKIPYTHITLSLYVHYSVMTNTLWRAINALGLQAVGTSATSSWLRFRHLISDLHPPKFFIRWLILCIAQLMNPSASQCESQSISCFLLLAVSLLEHHYHYDIQIIFFSSTEQFDEICPQRAIMNRDTDQSSK